MASILLVEDDELVANLFMKVLRRAGHDLLTANDGDQALEMARSATGEIGMVITDIVMPGMSGPEWVKQAKGELEQVPIMYISGYSDDARERHGLLVDDADLLTKPVNVNELLEIVSKRIETAD